MTHVTPVPPAPGRRLCACPAGCPFRRRLGLALGLTLLVGGALPACGSARDAPDADATVDGDVEPVAPVDPVLWRVIPLQRDGQDLRGYPTLGDLTGDGRPEIVIHRHHEGVVPAYLAALTLDGTVLWEWGDAAAEAHHHLLRGAVTIFDLDGDGAAEIHAECALSSEPQPSLCRFDGATGALLHSRPSPLRSEWREEIDNMRGVPLLFAANLRGTARRADFILKYDASETVTGRAWGLDTDFAVLWSYEGNLSHVPKVADVDGDGLDELASGDALLDDDGSVLWSHRFPGDTHVDEVEVGELDGDPTSLEVIISSGMHCVHLDGAFLWVLGEQTVAEGQRLLLRDLRADAPGPEIFVAHAAHARRYWILDRDGNRLLSIDNGGNYMDTPMPVAWRGDGLHQIWLPGTQRVIDGHNRLVADLSGDPAVAALAADHFMYPQAVAANVIGDEREELLVYFPYGGEEIRIYSPAPLDPDLVTPFVHREDLINTITNF